MSQPPVVETLVLPLHIPERWGKEGERTFSIKRCWGGAEGQWEGERKGGREGGMEG